jgi:large subunit ribosomal protein L18
MGKHTAPRRKARLLRQQRVRRHLAGTPARPRLAVFRSLRHIYAQIIDDSSGRTLASASTSTTNCACRWPDAGAQAPGGQAVASARSGRGSAVAFDRGGSAITAASELADGSREGGLDF